MPLKSEEDPVLDDEAIENARSILKDKYDEMVNVYIDNSWTHVEDIEKALADQNIEAVIRPAHTLKSTSKQMGALKLADQAKDIEYMAKAIQNGDAKDGQTIQTIADAMSSVKTMLSETKKAFDKLAA